MFILKNVIGTCNVSMYVISNFGSVRIKCLYLLHYINMTTVVNFTNYHIYVFFLFNHNTSINSFKLMYNNFTLNIIMLVNLHNTIYSIFLYRLFKVLKFIFFMF